MPSRRQILQASAAAIGARWLASGPIAAAEPNQDAPMTATPELSIVDTHQHLWDLSKFKLAWHADAPQLAHSFVMKDYLAATEGLGVVKSVYMEVDVEPSQQLAEAEYVIDLCQQGDNPMAAAVISGRPAADDFAAYAKRFGGHKYVKGLRQVLHGAGTPPGYCLKSEFIRGIKLLGELGLSFDVCMRSSEMADADALAAACPKTRLIVDHCGNMSVQETDAKQRKLWMDGLRALAQRDNVVCKVSGIVASAKEDWQPADLAPNINFTLDTFGPDRVMFGGDWPVCTLRSTYRRWVEALKSIIATRPLADQKKLLAGNALKFYGLA